MNFEQVIRTVYSHPIFLFVLALLAANVILGVAVALWTKTFRLGSLADWLVTRAIPMLLAAGGVQIVLMFLPGAGLPEEWTTPIQWVGSAVWLMAAGGLVGKIFTNLQVIFPHIPIPDFLKDKPKEEVTPTT